MAKAELAESKLAHKKIVILTRIDLPLGNTVNAPGVTHEQKVYCL